MKRRMVPARTGSAPQYALRHEDKSNAARASGVALRTHSS